jgi:hypothetical protein
MTRNRHFAAPLGRRSPRSHFCSVPSPMPKAAANWACVMPERAQPPDIVRSHRDVADPSGETSGDDMCAHVIQAFNQPGKPLLLHRLVLF